MELKKIMKTANSHIENWIPKIEKKSI